MNWTNLVFLITLVNVCAGGYLQVLLQSVSNPSGKLNNGDYANNFGFAGVGSDIFIKASLSFGELEPAQADLRKVSSLSNTATVNQILTIEDIPNDGESINYLTSFDVSIELYAKEDESDLIHKYTLTVNPDEKTGVQVYTQKRDTAPSTSITLAWASDLELSLPTTLPPTDVPNTESTFSPPPTVYLPRSCDETDLDESSVQVIYPDGTTAVSVYCVKNDKGHITVVQSRGEQNTNVSFDLDLAGYKSSFGEPEKTSNFWLGLDNLNQLTNYKTFNLAIELCCGAKTVSQLYYFNATIGDSSTKYKLQAVADVSGVGLAYNGPATDLNAVFSTKSTYSGSSMLCDEFGYYDDDTEKEVKASGAWWYGSCSNNLNGVYISAENLNTTSCSVKSEYFSKNQYLGINMRTTSGKNSDGYDVDNVSYTRARMVLFPFDPISYPHGDASGFCS